MSGRRTVVHDHEFEEQLQKLLVNAEEADEFIAAAECLLSRKPQLGSVAAEGPPQVWMLALPPIRDKAAALFYTFDDSTVILLAVVTYEDE